MSDESTERALPDGRTEYGGEYGRRLVCNEVVEQEVEHDRNGGEAV